MTDDKLRAVLYLHAPRVYEYGIGCACGWNSDGRGPGLWQEHMTAALTASATEEHRPFSAPYKAIEQALAASATRSRPMTDDTLRVALRNVENWLEKSLGIPADEVEGWPLVKERALAASATDEWHCCDDPSCHHVIDREVNARRAASATDDEQELLLRYRQTLPDVCLRDSHARCRSAPLAASATDDGHVTSTDQLEAEQRGLPIPYATDGSVRDALDRPTGPMFLPDDEALP